MRFLCESAQDYAEEQEVDLLVSSVAGGRHGELAVLALYAHSPGNGAGTRVMQNLCDLADAYACTLYLQPQTERNVRFYARFGFVQDDKRRYPPMILVRTPR